jgi:hypothetical protein
MKNAQKIMFALNMRSAAKASLMNVASGVDKYDIPIQRYTIFYNSSKK